MSCGEAESPLARSTAAWASRLSLPLATKSFEARPRSPGVCQPNAAATTARTPATASTVRGRRTTRSAKTFTEPILGQPAMRAPVPSNGDGGLRGSRLPFRHPSPTSKERHAGSHGGTRWASTARSADGSSRRSGREHQRKRSRGLPRTAVRLSALPRVGQYRRARQSAGEHLAIRAVAADDQERYGFSTSSTAGSGQDDRHRRRVRRPDGGGGPGRVQLAVRAARLHDRQRVLQEGQPERRPRTTHGRTPAGHSRSASTSSGRMRSRQGRRSFSSRRRPTASRTCSRRRTTRRRTRSTSRTAGARPSSAASRATTRTSLRQA